MATYPRHVHQRGGVYQVIGDDAAYQQAKADGWVDHPLHAWPVPDVYREWDGTPLEDAPAATVTKRQKATKASKATPSES